MMVFYENNSIPLELNTNPEIGDIIYTNEGDAYKCIELGKDKLFELLHKSVLIEGEYLEDLTDLQLKLFWKLSNSELDKLTEHEIKYSL
jgi:hypothetical protein